MEQTGSNVFVVYLISVFAFIAIDYIWLAKVSPKLYRENIGHLMAEKPNLKAALLFYAVFLVGLSYFVLWPALELRSIGNIVIPAVIYGLTTYATFDLTSQAVFKKWPRKITIIDLAWGTLLTLATSVVTYTVATSILS